jgi:hypothetical protein
LASQECPRGGRGSCAALSCRDRPRSLHATARGWPWFPGQRGNIRPAMATDVLAKVPKPASSAGRQASRPWVPAGRRRGCLGHADATQLGKIPTWSQWRVRCHRQSLRKSTTERPGIAETAWRRHFEPLSPANRGRRWATRFSRRRRASASPLLPHSIEQWQQRTYWTFATLVLASAQSSSSLLSA